MDLLDEEKVIDKKIGQFIHTCFGYLIREIRLMSPLSHNEMMAISSITAATSKRLENHANFSIHSYMEASFYHLRSLKCTFNLHHLCVQVTEALGNGKCLVIIPVDSNELSKYDKHRIIFRQQSDDTEELERRAKQEREKLQIAQKVSEKIRKAKPKKPALTRKKRKKK